MSAPVKIPSPESRHGSLEIRSFPYSQRNSSGRILRLIDVRCHGCGRAYALRCASWGKVKTCNYCRPQVHKIAGWNKLTDELLDQVIALREADIPDSEIAKKIGCSRTAIQRRLGPNGRPHGNKQIYTSDVDGNAPSCPHCNCCPMYLQPSTGRFTQCNRCATARGYHSFKDHCEYDDYLLQGCWVCGMSADRIDHNHDTCPKRYHSCERCRRGPACASCNNILVEGVTVEMLLANAKKYETIATANYRVAEALVKLELAA